MKQKRIKRLISLLLAAVIGAGIFPAAAQAYNPFSDIDPSAWYYWDVLTAVESGLVNGKTESTFCPDEYLTCAEAVKLAACLNQLWWDGEVSLTNGTPWYRPYVDYAWEVGILSEEYRWDEKATRADFLKLFANTLPSDALSRINDVPDGSIPDVPSWYPDAWAIYLLYRAGVVQGSDSIHSCNPESLIKRSEVAAILTRMTEPSARLSFDMSEDYDEYEENDWYDEYEDFGREESAAGPDVPKYRIVVDFYDREDLSVYTEATTLGMLLSDNGITLSEGEVPSVDLWNEWLAEDMTVTVDKYFSYTEENRKILPHTTEQIEVDTIPRGDVNVLQAGVDGESIMHYTVTLKNGQEIERTLDWEEPVSVMVPEKSEIGVGGTLVGKDGVTYSYSWRRICTATYYNIYNYTYSGNYVSTRTVATNFSTIPLGTRMYIKNDRYDFGYRVSEDTGSGLAPWQVDIWMPDDDPNAPLMSVEGLVRDMEVYFLD